MPPIDITIVPLQTSLDFLRGLTRPSSKVTAQDIDDWRCSLALDWLEARTQDVTTLESYLSAPPAIPVLAI